MQIQINTDALFITNRLKQIDEDYYVIYSTTKKRYELHHKNQIGGSYCLACPYPVLDERFVVLAQKTRSENRKKLMQEIDDQNEKLEKQNIKNIIQTIGERL